MGQLNTESLLEIQMVHTIKHIDKGEKLNLTGDCVIEGDIAELAEINLMDGSLSVLGSIKNGVKINISLSVQPTTQTSNLKLTTVICESGMCGLVTNCDNNIKNYTGGVIIHNRIFSNDTVEVLGEDEYKIIPRSKDSPLNRNVRFVVNDVEQPPVASIPGLATARIDGKNYQGKEISVKGKMVLVDGKKVEANSSTIPMLTIHGDVDDNVKINSEIAIAIQGRVGSMCEIQCPNVAMTANEIGKESKITAKNMIATNIYDRCILKTSSSLQADQLQNSVTVVAGTAITIKNNIGDGCILESAYGAVTAENTGINCKISSTHAGVKMRNVGVNSKIRAFNDADVRNVGEDSVIESKVGGVSARDLGENVTINSFESVSIKGKCPRSAKLKSTVGTVKKISAATTSAAAELAAFARRITAEVNAPEHHSSESSSTAECSYFKK